MFGNFEGQAKYLMKIEDIIPFQSNLMTKKGAELENCTKIRKKYLQKSGILGFKGAYANGKIINDADLI